MLHNMRINTGLIDEDKMNILPLDDLNPDIDNTQMPAQLIQLRRNYVLNNFNVQ
jgi:hypothetical protein